MAYQVFAQDGLESTHKTLAAAKAAAKRGSKKRGGEERVYQGRQVLAVFVDGVEVGS